MSLHEDGFKGERTTPESFRRRHQADRGDQREDSVNSPFGSDLPDRYFLDKQTSTTDFYTYTTTVKGGDPNMANPYLDRGHKMPYEISQNRYKEHVLGSKYENFNQQRPEALDGYDQLRKSFPNILSEPKRPRSVPAAIPESNIDYHNWPIGAHPLELAHERRYNRQPQYQDSPRYTVEPRQFQSYREPERKDPPQQYFEQSPRDESRTYRSGRPDIGVQRESYVPYPQEPVRKSRHDYEQPPDIGFDPYKDTSRKPDPSEEDGIGPHPGWVLLMRFDREGEDQVRKALTFAGQISKDGGMILGIARPYGIRIKEGGDGWVTFGRMIYHQGQKEIQQTPIREQTRYCVLAIYYPSLRKAQEWFDRDSWFKQKDFPYPYATDCIALPLSSAIDPRVCKTLVLTEYPKISHADFFRDRFSVPTENLMRSKFRATPYIVKAFSVPTFDMNQRVARHFRGCWIKRNSIITMSAFESMAEVDRYFKDQEYSKCKEYQDRVSAPTTVIFDLESAGHY